MSLFYTSVDRHGNNILFRGYNDGKAIKRKVAFAPTLYINSPRPTDLKTLDGRYVAPIDFESMADAYDFCKKHKEVQNFQVHGTQNYVHQAISDMFNQEGCPWDINQINVTSIDIEVQSDSGFPHANQARHPVTAITMRSSIDDVYFCWGLGQYDPEQTVNTELTINYVQCQDEQELLKRFLAHWQYKYPDIITGWNSRLFDMVYLVNRIGYILGESYMKQLSPWLLVKENVITIGENEHQVFDIVGVQQLDYMDLFKKFAYKYGTQESYKLDHIANTVLGLKKLDYSEYSSLFDLYKKDHQKFIDYNIRDTSLVDKMEEKLGLISLCLTIAYKGLVNYSEAFGPVNMWDALIYNELRRKNIVVPPKIAKIKLRQIEGAYVKDPICGLHHWIVSFDVASLYPHIIMQYNMSPETIVGETHPGVSVENLLNKMQLRQLPGHCMTATGQYFSTAEGGVLPRMVQSLYNERNIVKKEMLEIDQKLEKAKDPSERKYLERESTKRYNQEQAIKILMNSLYGAMSNEFFRYYDMRIAESITVTGQLTIQWAEKRVNDYLNKVLKTDDNDYVVAIDTDSLYINFGPLVNKYVGDKPTIEQGVEFLDKVCKEKINDILSTGYDELKTYLNCAVQKISMKREIIGDKGIWTGKKHYILNVHNSEGVQYSEPKLKMKGIEAVRSSTPAACRQSIKKALNVIMNSDELTLQQFVRDFKQKFNTLPFEEVAFPRGVRGIDKYKDSALIYAKGTPIHVRGALLFNTLLEKYGIRNIPAIQDGDKIKFCYLKMPNPVHDNVIAVADYLPAEFNIDAYIDRDMQFDKSFLEPLKTITNAINWNVEKKATLEEWF
jgi:DNA polymerase elongation subunit (family B)